MAQSKAETVDEYLQELPDDRKETIAAVRELILENLPDGYQETMNWGMINYEIPLERYPDTYNDQPLGYLALAAQKNYNALYILSVYQDKELYEWFKNQFKKAGKKFDMGKSCLRFKSIDDLVLDAIKKIVAHQTPDEFIEAYEESRNK